MTNDKQAPWRTRVEQLIAALALEAYLKANRNKDGTMKKRRVPYVLPDVAQHLVACLGSHDQVEAEKIAKSIMTHDYEAERALKPYVWKRP